MLINKQRVSLHAGLKENKMREQISYITPIYDLSKEFTPKRVLELGCGNSTYFFRWLWHKSEMVVIDDHPIWMRGNEDMGGNYKINKRIIVDGLEEFKKEVIGNGKFDFIFVDCGHSYNNSGPWRAVLMEVIRKNNILNPGGKLVLHDTQHEGYEKECNKWPKITKFDEYRTWIMESE